MTNTAYGSSRDRGIAVMIAAAASITVLDGYDAFSLSLMMPAISRELGIPTAAIGPVFASAMGGMIVGALGGGALADRIGRLQTLTVALVLFGGAALTMPLMGGAGAIIANRIVSGIGLGAAAPIAVALLNQASDRPPSAFMVSLVWVGIAVGGMIAALANYVLAAPYGWRPIFLIGGLAPLPAAGFAWWAFRGSSPLPRGAGAPPRGRLSDLFVDGRAWRTIGVAAMFFFGFTTTSIIVYWLPTILAHRAASPLMISVSFASVNGGAVVATALLGWLASRRRDGLVRTLAWSSAALCGLVIAAAPIDTVAIATLAVCGATIGAAAQALSIALANDLHRTSGLQGTSVGLMAGCGRLGQFCSLGISSAVVRWSGQETMVFGLAASTAVAAALLSAIVSASARTIATAYADPAGDAHA